MTPEPAIQLLTTLERSGPYPVLAWYGEASRIELSGHVLANWVIKSIGHLHDEIGLEPGDSVVLDLPPHWKRLVLALAAWSLGAEVTVLDREHEIDPLERGAGDRTEDAPGVSLGEEVPADPRVVATDRPGSALASSADEVLALQAVSLAPRYDGELPPLAHDWVAEVRASPDRLGVPLPTWSGPRAPEAVASAVEGAPPRLLLGSDGLTTLPEVLASWLAGGGFVSPASCMSERQAAEESVTGRA